MKDDWPARIVDLTFPHHWQAKILSARPLILPPRHFVYPKQAEEVERGALEVLIRPAPPGHAGEGADVLKGHAGAPWRLSESVRRSESAVKPAEALADCGKNQRPPQEVPGHDFSRGDSASKSAGALAREECLSQPSLDGPHSPESPSAQPFLATCALGFRDPIVPTGVWSCPNPDEICAVSGGYAYMIDTAAPDRFTMIPFRPVLEIRALPAQALLLFVGHHAILAWGASGQAWQSEKLSDEGVTITSIDGAQLHGLGWGMISDNEAPFNLDLKTGLCA